MDIYFANQVLMGNETSVEKYGIDNISLYAYIHKYHTLWTQHFEYDCIMISE